MPTTNSNPIHNEVYIISLTFVACKGLCQNESNFKAIVIGGRTRIKQINILEWLV